MEYEQEDFGVWFVNLKTIRFFSLEDKFLRAEKQIYKYILFSSHREEREREQAQGILS